MSENKKKFNYSFYKDSHSSIEEVITHMVELDNELHGTTLENLCAFNTTYLIITRAVAGRLGKNYFEQDSLMQKFDIIFAQYYFDALSGYISGKSIAGAWLILFDACERDSCLQSQYMALGVNAHVNNDLAFSLREMEDNNQNDFLKINFVIRQSLSEVILSLNEKNKHLQNFKNWSKPVYGELLTMLIKNWRSKAWNNYRLLTYNETSRVQIEQAATRLARYLKIR